MVSGCHSEEGERPPSLCVFLLATSELLVIAERMECTKEQIMPLKLEVRGLRKTSSAAHICKKGKDSSSGEGTLARQ